MYADTLNFWEDKKMADVSTFYGKQNDCPCCVVKGTGITKFHIKSDGLATTAVEGAAERPASVEVRAIYIYSIGGEPKRYRRVSKSRHVKAAAKDDPAIYTTRRNPANTAARVTTPIETSDHAKSIARYITSDAGQDINVFCLIVILVPPYLYLSPFLSLSFSFYLFDVYLFFYVVYFVGVASLHLFCAPVPQYPSTPVPPSYILSFFYFRP